MLRLGFLLAKSPPPPRTFDGAKRQSVPRGTLYWSYCTYINIHILAASESTETGYDAREGAKDCAVLGRSSGVVKQPLAGICYAVIITELILFEKWPAEPPTPVPLRFTGPKVGFFIFKVRLFPARAAHPEGENILELLSPLSRGAPSFAAFCEGWVAD